jgi:hypothetical protein
MQNHDTRERANIKAPSIFSAQGLKRILEGELVPHRRKSGEIQYYRVMGFCVEDSAIMAATGNEIVETTRQYPDSRGVYKVSVIIRGVKSAHPKPFFPREWSWSQTARAIEEAYQSRVPCNWTEQGNFYEGISSSGIKIVLELDDAGLVLDAIPIRSGRFSPRRQAQWLLEQGKIEKSRFVCGECHAIKVYVCERGHNLPVSLLDSFGLRWLLRRRFNKLKKAVKRHLRRIK